MADSLELHFIVRTDTDSQKEIPMDSAFADTVISIVWMVYGFGISLSVIANVIMNSGEAFVKAIADQTGAVFGNVKIVFDISCVAFSIVLSLFLFDFTIVGTREGTLIAALFTGVVVKVFQRLLFQSVNTLLVE